MSHSRQTILVIDDDEDLTTALSKRLDSLGLRSITAPTGTQGLAHFRREHLALVITDLNMPEGDGVTLAETIRRTSSVPIIFITGHRDDFKRRLRDIHNVSTLRKPFQSQDLIDLIMATIGKSPALPLPADIELETP